MLRATPNPRNTAYIHPNSLGTLDGKAYCNFTVLLQIVILFTATVPTRSESIWKVSIDVIVSLKSGLISIFNDSFSKQLLEVSQVSHF